MPTNDQQLVEQTASAISTTDKHWQQVAVAHHERLTKPVGSLGELETIGVQLCRIQQQVPPSVENIRVVVCAADHGITRNHALGPFPREVTAQMVSNFVAGGAAVNVIANSMNADFLVVDTGVDADLGGLQSPSFLSLPVARGTADLSAHAAMSEAQLNTALANGIRVADQCAEKGYDAVALGEMGIGNTTVASAMTAALLQLSPAAVTGRGTGADDATLQRKISTIETALQTHQVNPDNGYEILQKLGGFEIATLAGLSLGLAHRRITIVADGFISTVAALAACRINPLVREYIFSGHLSPEPGHRYLLDELGKKPILDLGLRLGEGTGACLALALLRTSARLMAQMATFDEAGVDGREKDAE